MSGNVTCTCELPVALSTMDRNSTHALPPSFPSMRPAPSCLRRRQISAHRGFQAISRGIRIAQMHKNGGVLVILISGCPKICNRPPPVGIFIYWGVSAVDECSGQPTSSDLYLHWLWGSRSQPPDRAVGSRRRREDFPRQPVPLRRCVARRGAGLDSPEAVFPAKRLETEHLETVLSEASGMDA